MIQISVLFYSLVILIRFIPTIYHIRRSANLHVMSYSLMVVQVFTLGRVSSGKRCKCSSAHSAAYPEEKLQRLATCFICASQFTASSPSKRGQDPTTVHTYLGIREYTGTCKYSNKRAVFLTFLLQHTAGKINSYRPDSQVTSAVMELGPSVNSEF